MNGPEISEALRSVRAFHVSVAKLLQTADGLMAERGFNVHSSCRGTALAGRSNAISDSQKWSPEYAFRWYAVPGHPEVLAWVSVLFSPSKSTRGHDGFQARNADEPLATAGWMRFEGGVPKTGSHFFHYARSYWWSDQPADGRWDPPYRAGDAVIRQAMAYPLTGFGSAEDVREKLVEPLAEQANKAGSTRVDGPLG